MLTYISNTDHYNLVLSRVASVRRSLWIGTADTRNVISNKIQINNMDFFIKIWIGNLDFLYFCRRIKNKSYGIKGTFTASVI